jgi:hypothetical protein
LAKMSVLPMLSRRFNITDYSIAPTLAGASHSFEVGGTSVEVRLPLRPRKNERRSRGLFGNERINCSRMQKGRPACFEVHSVDVVVTLRRRVMVHPEALTNQRSDFNDRERAVFERLIASANDIASEALDRWLRVLRWKSLNSAIGQPRMLGAESGWGPYLLDATNRQRFYAGTHYLTAYGDQPVSKRVWNAAGQALSHRVVAPVWFDFLFEGEHRIRYDDLHGGVVCLAVAFESIIRRLMTMHLARPVNRDYARIVNRISISQFIDRWKRLGLWTPKWKQSVDLPKMKRVFELRNDVMHEGYTEMNKDECGSLAGAARLFIVHASPYAEALSA